MKLTTKTDLEAPANFVYAMLTDYPTWEREAVRRGVEIERPADMPLSGIGSGWRIRAPYRGKLRKLLIRLDAAAPDEALSFGLDSPSVDGTADIELTVLSPRRSRLRVTVNIRPKTLAARLFINTMRLARRRVDARLESRIKSLAARIEPAQPRARAGLIRPARGRPDTRPAPALPR
jgi:hypothetical protein